MYTKRLSWGWWLGKMYNYKINAIILEYTCAIIIKLCGFQRRSILNVIIDDIILNIGYYYIRYRILWVKIIRELNVSQSPYFHIHIKSLIMLGNSFFNITRLICDLIFYLTSSCILFQQRNKNQYHNLMIILIS